MRTLSALALVFLAGCGGIFNGQQPVVDADAVVDTYTRVSDPGLPSGLSMLRSPVDTLYCIGSEVDSHAAVLGWLANNNFLDSPVFGRLFLPDRADEYVYLSHGHDHTIELNYYGTGWDSGSAWPPSTTDRNVVSAFMLLSHEDRLTAIAALTMLKGRIVADIDSSVFVAQFMRTAQLMASCPPECVCTPATEWPADSLLAFSKNNWREGLGLEP